MQKVALWFENLPSPVRHSLLVLAVLEAGVALNGFAGAQTWQDLTAAAVALPLALVVGLIRWAVQVAAGAGISTNQQGMPTPHR